MAAGGLKENCIPRDRQQRKSSEVIPMMRMEKSKRSRITGIDMQKRMEEVAKFIIQNMGE